MTNRKKRLGYIVRSFPAIYSTFEMREMVTMNQMDNIDVYVFSLMTPRSKNYSIYSESLLSNTFNYPFLISFTIVQAQLYFLLRKPRTYCRILKDIFKNNCNSLIVLLKSIAIFPKSVLFAKIMEEHEIDHIHAHFVHIPTTAAVIIWQLTGIQFSCTAHNSDIYQYPPTDLEERINLATPFITISDYWKRYLINRFGEKVRSKIKVIHCQIDLDEFKPVPRKQTMTVRLLTVARLEPIKGLCYLIEACHLLRERGLDFQCDIIGDGSERRNLGRLVRRNELESIITFHGTVLPENMHEFYQKSDIFILPSFREGIPVSIMEAMAMELPVVSTNVFGIPELVTDCNTGFLVNPGNAEELANAIVTLYRDRELRLRFGKKGRYKIEQDFNIKKIIRQLFSLFYSIESQRDIANGF